MHTAFLCFSSCESQCFCSSSLRLPVFKRKYSREFLLNVNRTSFHKLNPVQEEELRDYGLLRRPATSPTPSPAPRPQWRQHKWRQRKQKRGKRGGIRARLAASPHKPAIPTIILANVHSLDNKLDYLRLLRTTQKSAGQYCVYVFTETWLNNNVTDPDNIPGRVLRDCAGELTDVFTDIFNISLSQAVVPTCFKTTTIIPVPKKSSPSCFND